MHGMLENLIQLQTVTQNLADSLKCV
jgi:hypothetical protein